jgi:hypothetical protein
MNRTGLLAAVAVMLASSPSYGQFGGTGGMGGGMGGMGGGMGGGNVARQPGMMMQGGRFAGAAFTEIRRSAKVEMEGGQLLSGTIDLRPVIVDTDLGQYVITPKKIKIIRFLKPAVEGKPADEAEGNNDAGAGGDAGDVVVRVARQNRIGAIRAVRGGFGGGGPDTVADPNSRTGTAVLTRGKVITLADKEILGMVHVPGDFTLELDFGTLTLAPVKLRSITFADDNRQDGPAKAAASAPSTPENVGQPPSGEAASPPRYLRLGSSLIVISPVGDRVTLYNLGTKKSEALALSGPKDATLEVTPILAGNLVALMLRGPKLTRIAVADTASGNWHVQSLRKPVEGQAVPIVAQGVVVYKLGRDVYAYGAEAQRWDVVEMPEGLQAMPVVGPGTVTIEGDGHIYTFAGKTGKWDHVDLRTILDAGAEKK